MKHLDRRVDIRLPRLALISVLIAIALTPVLLFNRSNEKVAGQNLVLGKLAVGTRMFQFPSAQTFWSIRTGFADGSNSMSQVVFSSQPMLSTPTWSPDGTKLAYVIGSTTASEIWVANADGTSPVNLTNTASVGESNPSWSPAGKILYTRESQVWTMDQNGANQAQFTAITQPSPSGSAYSLDGSKIVFVSGNEIWKINSDGTGQQQVTTNASSDFDPAWSPDGSKIVFQKSGTGIAVIDATGSNEVMLTTDTSDAKPAWSSDGTLIAFRRSGVAQGIYVMDSVGGSQLRVVTDVGGPASVTNDDPAWQPTAQAPNTFTISGTASGAGSLPAGVTVSLRGTVNAVTTTNAIGYYQFSGLPAGGSYTVSASMVGHFFTNPTKTFTNLASNGIADFVGKEFCFGSSCAKNGRIAFVSGQTTIFTINPNGTGRLTLTAGNHPNYSPDGTKVIFSTNRDGNNEIYRVNADGTNPVRLTDNGASDTQPFHSPDGSSIVFTSNRDGNEEIYRMNADGSNPVRLTNETASDRMPAYSPDGLKIIFVTSRTGSSNHRIFSMNPDGSNQVVVSDVAGVYFRPSYRPDGGKIIFGYGSFEPMFDIWTMNPNGTDRQQIISNRVENPTYSPDSGRIAYKCCGNIELDINGLQVTGFGRVTQNIGDDWPSWQRIFAPRPTAFDFDGDSRSDISVFRPSDQVWHLLRSQAGYISTQWGLSTDTLVPADYDGDLKTDVAIWRSSDRNYYILNSSDSTVRIEDFGVAGDVPLQGDWDNDGKSDLTVYRAGAPGVFYYRNSIGNPGGVTSLIEWGTTGDKPVLGDYDGDGRTDAAVFRPSTSIWYVRRSSNGSMLANTFGLSDDKLVPADYDADGKTDLAVYRGGVWYLLRSTEGFLAFNYGLGSDIPVPADYDGDGRADAAVYRNGVWYRLKSTGGDDVVAFGLSTDKPLQARPQ